MSLFDHDMDDSLDKMFDLNHDGNIDPSEQSFMYETYKKAMNTPESFDRVKDYEKHFNTSDRESIAQGVLYVVAAVVIFIILGVSCVGGM